MTRDQYIAEARTWLGTPYHHQGRLKAVGVDCVGVICGLAAWGGVSFTDLKGYNRFARGVDISGELAKYLEEIPMEDARAADVLTFWIRKPEIICHSGVLVDIVEGARRRPGLLHTHAEVGQVVEHGLSDYWMERRVRAFRFPGLED